jgi:Na+-transporting NADH:ubiquinone oxidoreductase subunit NqrE
MSSFSVKYVFKGKPPNPFTTIVVLGVVNFVALMLVGATRKLWETPSTPFGEQLAAALSLYVSQGMTVHFALLGGGLLCAFVYRREMVRVPVPSVGDRPASPFDVAAAATMAPAFCGFVGSFIAGALYSQVDRAWGVGIAVLVVLASVWTTDRLIFSFPSVERFRKRRPAIWIWAAIVSILALVFVMSDFG